MTFRGFREIFEVVGSSGELSVGLLSVMKESRRKISCGGIRLFPVMDQKIPGGVLVVLNQLLHLTAVLHVGVITLLPIDKGRVWRVENGGDMRLNRDVTLVSVR